MEGSGSTLDSFFGLGRDLIGTAGQVAKEAVRARYTRSPDPSQQDPRSHAVAIPAAATRVPTTPGTAPVAGLSSYAPMFLVVAAGVLIVGLALKKLG